MKKIFFLLVTIILFSCGELQQIAKEYNLSEGLGNEQIAEALKQALNQGIDREVSKLMKVGGFYNQPDVRILWPEELQQVDKTLRKIGLGNLADEGIKKLNRAAEEAVKEAKPIFVDAIKQMTFQDAKNILMGGDNAATEYLKKTTTDKLYQKFYPVVQNSFKKVGADQIWNQIISRYNKVPFVQKVNPDLNDYVTRKALEGVFKKIEVEEKKIRSDVQERTTDLMKKVFALQDKK